MKAMKPSDMAKMMDKDKDGYVTKKEFMEFYDKFFKALDNDGKGKLSTAMFTDQG
jgi:Ca2+-binding EF-hand superfamily protein